MAECNFQLAANNRRRKDVYRLPHADQESLENLGYKQKLNEVDQAILANAEFLDQIVANPEIFGHDMAAVEGEYDDENDGTASFNSSHEEDRNPGVAE
jgi:carnosine N-methyltransferase